ncbi:hypothetical protein Y032_0044g928 [Ancylostoma ceylanicum]|uniref:Uncharacterized protein n=1 Tax=Ancylostoma ceylanicum TaxID=53326 RepID=A0A016UEI1_9BILA|nr:hypothetical protein Y032_0044g928 [Ancylostoma ceylanicum]
MSRCYAFPKYRILLCIVETSMLMELQVLCEKSYRSPMKNAEQALSAFVQPSVPALELVNTSTSKGSPTRKDGTILKRNVRNLGATTNVACSHPEVFTRRLVAFNSAQKGTSRKHVVLAQDDTHHKASQIRAYSCSPVSSPVIRFSSYFTSPAYWALA